MEERSRDCRCYPSFYPEGLVESTGNLRGFLMSQPRPTYKYLSIHEGYHERENLWSEPIVYWEEEIPLRPQFSLLLADVGETPPPLQINMEFRIAVGRLVIVGLVKVIYY
jgi:hypothetical protein